MNCDCRDIESKLAEYVDGEQPPSERDLVDGHLQRCPPCRARASAEHAAREALCARREILRGSAPEALRHRCAQQRSLGVPSRPLVGRRPWVPLSVAASLVLATGLFLLFGWGSSVETYAAQLSADHLKCFQFPPETSEPPDLEILARHWQENGGWALKVRSAAAPGGLTLLGLRRCGSTRGRLAHLLFKWRGEPLSVYVLNRRFDHAPDAGHDHDVTRLGEHAIVWANHERTYAVVGHRRIPDLHRVAVYVRQSIQ